jgi:hypothetical protein
MLVNRMYVELAECKNAITLLMSVLRMCDIAFEGVRTNRCIEANYSEDLHQSAMSSMCPRMRYRKRVLANAMQAKQQMHRLMSVFSAK